MDPVVWSWLSLILFMTALSVVPAWIIVRLHRRRTPKQIFGDKLVGWYSPDDVECDEHGRVLVWKDRSGRGNHMKGGG